MKKNILLSIFPVCLLWIAWPPTPILHVFAFHRAGADAGCDRKYHPVRLKKKGEENIWNCLPGLFYMEHLYPFTGFIIR
jgi:hypothetical protein